MTHNPSKSLETRRCFSATLQAGEKFEAIRLAKVLLEESQGLPQLSFIARELEKVRGERNGLRPFKIALLSSFSLDFIKHPLMVFCFLNGIEAEIYLGGFGQYQQEVRDSNSGLYAFAPDVLIIAVEGADGLPEIYKDYLERLPTGFDGTLSRFQEEFLRLITTFREKSKATVLVHNFTVPLWRGLGILDSQTNSGQTHLIHRVNASLASICEQNPGVLVVDYAGLVGRVGTNRWYDERMAHYAKAPIAMEMLPHLAREYVKFFRGITGQTKKCLVLDLDNTLWGGVLGEDGINGIQLGSTYPGSAYAAFQREIRNLQKRGVLLAIASKNNVADVDEVFAKHTGMVLKREHFSGIQIHWGPKSESLRGISRQLNIGLEHIVLVDDSPAECAEVARALPMVTTIALPKRPELFVGALLEDGLFDGITSSSEDARRGELYRQKEDAEQLRERSGSLEDFYRSLEMEVTFASVDKTSLARSAQLTQKTNQFNVTTVRCSEADIASRTKDQDWLMTTVVVRDRFGDNGIVGLMMARIYSGALDIETFLLSCRVIGRTVETAMLAYLCQQASNHGLNLLCGRVVPTAKNAPVRDLFLRHAFQLIEEKNSGETTWTLDLRKALVSSPEWIKIVADMPVATNN